jgi:hypothetical protein
MADKEMYREKFENKVNNPFEGNAVISGS